MGLIYHITTQTQWDASKDTEQYTVPSLQEEGFIHCSDEGQVKEIIERFYAGAKDVIVLSIDTDKLTSQLIFEWSPSVQQTFPHIYGPINTHAVTAAVPWS
jgi:uncharacterized protein (DUF952 family)